jgi:hypothetical protein
MFCIKDEVLRYVIPSFRLLVGPQALIPLELSSYLAIYFFTQNKESGEQL